MILLRKNDKVAKITIRYGYIISIDEIYDANLFPVGIYPKTYEIGKDPEKDADILNKWWKQNSIPVERDSIRLGLECIGVESQDELKILGQGISLSNPYWIKKENDETSWEMVNYWDNPFNEGIGVALFNHKPLRDNPNMWSPDSGLNGMLKKKWIAVNGDYYLVKSGKGSAKEEAFNEILASDILSFLDIPHAEYTFRLDEGEISCACKCFTGPFKELIHITQVHDYLGGIDNKYDEYAELNNLYSLCDYFGVKGYKEYINKVLVLDYIIAGTDRHYNNLAFIYDEMNNSYEFSPVYDSGTAMWSDKIAKDIDPDSDDITARPFCNTTTFGTWDKQKQYISEMPDLSEDDMIYSLRHYYKLMCEYSDISEERIKKLATACLTRFYNLEDYIKGRNNPEYKKEDHSEILQKLSVEISACFNSFRTGS